MITTDRRRWRRLLALVAVLALFATACGGGDDDAKGGNDAPPAEEESKGDPNGIIRLGYDLAQETQPVALDPFTAKSNAGANDGIMALVYGRFMRELPDGSYTPDLAEKVEIVDTKTIEITLRDGLTFSDGSAFDGDAVKASLDKVIASREEPNVQDAYLSQWWSLESVEVTSPTVVVLHIPDGTAAAWYDQNIVKWKTSIAKVGPTFEPIGAGPFKVVSHTVGQKLVLTKNDKYWNADKVTYGGIEFHNIAFNQPQSAMAALRSGQLDATFTDPSQLAGLSAPFKEFVLTSARTMAVMHVCKEGPLADKRVRIAINKGIDREAIDEAIFEGTAEPATQLWPAGHKFNSADLDDFLAYDPEGAKELLKEAGFEKGLTIDLYPIGVSGLAETAEVFKQQMAEIGITINMHVGANYVEDFLKPNRAGLGLYPASSANTDKLSSWVGDSPGNVCDYNNPELTELKTKLDSVSMSDPVATGLWEQANKIVIENALGVFIEFRGLLAAYNDDKIGDMSGMPHSQYVIPDPFKTFVKS